MPKNLFKAVLIHSEQPGFLVPSYAATEPPGPPLAHQRQLPKVLTWAQRNDHLLLRGHVKVSGWGLDNAPRRIVTKRV